MSKKRNKKVPGGDRREVVTVALEEIHVSERTLTRLLRKDRGQVEQMRAEYESGRRMVRVVLRPRCGGGYNVEDGRHRVIAAKIAGDAVIEAIII